MKQLTKRTRAKLRQLPLTITTLATMTLSAGCSGPPEEWQEDGGMGGAAAAEGEGIGGAAPDDVEDSSQDVRSVQQAYSQFTIQHSCSPGNGTIVSNGYFSLSSNQILRHTLYLNGNEIAYKECSKGSTCNKSFSVSQAGIYQVRQAARNQLWPWGPYKDHENAWSNSISVDCGPPSCPMGTYDGANCYIGHPPTSPFIWSGNLYYGDVNGSCPVAGSSFDGANCFVAPAWMKPFIYNGNLYVKPN